MTSDSGTFSPLRCGAFVATTTACSKPLATPSLSVPYGAGRSLRLSQNDAARYFSIAFSPLRCGAFVATGLGDRRHRGAVGFQSPTVRGVRCDVELDLDTTRYTTFSPLRCGAFVATTTVDFGTIVSKTFSPLRCGAFVATSYIPCSQTLAIFFQSPTVRGVRCDHSGQGRPLNHSRLSVPYGAGRSLRLFLRRGEPAADVLSVPYGAGRSLRRWQRRVPSSHFSSFSPLRCGAFVATPNSGATWTGPHDFQSPTVRGVRCDARRPASVGPGSSFQSPTVRGVRCDPGTRTSRSCPRRAFSPLRCGAFVATRLRPARVGASFFFQSPTVRGVRCDHRPADLPRDLHRFQSPTVRGVRCDRGTDGTVDCPDCLSVPYGAGRSLRPLGVGYGVYGLLSFQSPTVRGVRCDRHPSLRQNSPSRAFSPLRCGAFVATLRRRAQDRRALPFSPLRCGAFVATCHDDPCGAGPRPPFSPLRCGAFVATPAPRALRRAPAPFSPLRCGAFVATAAGIRAPARECLLSVPYGAGRSLRRSPAGRAWPTAPTLSVPYGAGRSLRPGAAPRRGYGGGCLSVPYGAGRSLRRE